MNHPLDSTLQTLPLHRMFNEVPVRYDLMNRVITWGMDRRWRRLAARECLASSPERMLDLCCGTGDLAIEVARLSKHNIELAGLDYCQPMLDIAAGKARHPGVKRQINFVHDNAADLPFPDGHFDCVGISFAFRNLTYRNPLARQCLGETLRVLREGGSFVIVESSQPGAALTRKLFHLYLRQAVPLAGRLFSASRAAYSYLAESAARFYTREDVAGMLLESGFSRVSSRPLFFGAVAIHVAVK
ncbi:MAG: ubiquinone/menaquinone biosynthesis methyltransferase [Chloroflexi bacterium]|nr:ubiquinone/menaquinone biosynthesis methyltransferase [Chloroflexota bacterium]